MPTLSSLVAHEDKRDTMDVTTKAIFAVFLLRCIQVSGYLRYCIPQNNILTKIEISMSFCEQNWPTHFTFQFEIPISNTEKFACSPSFLLKVEVTGPLHHNATPEIPWHKLRQK